MPNFALSKWYLDAVSDTGDAFIGYSAQLRWRSLRLHYSSLIEEHAQQRPITSSTLRRGGEPTLLGGEISWSCEPLGVVGRWSSLADAVSATLLETAEGRVVWRCQMPRARVSIGRCQRSMEGLGYAEQLILTIPPWKLPIDELWWGRFLGKHHTLIWADWRGSHARQVVLLDGAQVGPARIDEHGVTIDSPRAQFRVREARLLRSGTLRESALKILSPFRPLFPARAFAVEETKWCARGAFDLQGSRDEGWSIFEVVRWPRR